MQTVEFTQIIETDGKCRETGKPLYTVAAILSDGTDAWVASVWDGKDWEADSSYSTNPDDLEPLRKRVSRIDALPSNWEVDGIRFT